MSTFLGPFPVAAAMQRVSDEAPLLKFVGVATDLKSALDAQPNTVPAAYICRDERSEPARGGSNGVLVQMCRAALQIVVFVRNHGDPIRVRAEMDAVLGQLRGALLKWSPDEGRFFNGLEHQAGRDEFKHGAHLVCQEIFVTRYPIEVRP